MVESDRIDPKSFLVTQLYSATTSFTHRIVIRGFITPILRLARVDPNPDERVTGS